MTRVFLLALSIAIPSSLAAQTLNDSRLRVQNWCTGLSGPCTFAWIGPLEMLVIEKDTGRVKWIKDGVVQGTAIDFKVQHDSERGGLGICPDPDFANNKYVYVYYSTTSHTADSTNTNQWVDNRVERYEWNGTNLVNMFGPIVAFPKDANQSNGANHDGGVIKFGPDGKLYGQTGDLNRGRMGGKERVEQNTATSGTASVGGTFRLNPDGSIPSDNPFVTEADSSFHLWYQYGMRNAFGMTWDPVNGNMWNTENGPDQYDEVNRVPWASNSGWLKIMGPDSRDATYGENGNTAWDASDLTYLDNAFYLDPELSFRSPVGITAIGFVDSKRFPEDLRNNCIIGDNNLGNLYYCEMKFARDSFKLPSGLVDKVADNTTERNKIVWGNSFIVTTDIQVGSDGYIYVALLGSGKISRIRPVTDMVEPSEFRLPPDVVPANNRTNVEVSDDKYYILEEKLGSVAANRLPSMVFEETFELNAANPTAITLELESHYRHFGFVQELRVWNTTSGAWDLVDSAVLGATDVLRPIGLANPTQYVDAATLEVKVRVVVTPLSPGGLPAPSREPVKMFIDLNRLLVTYP